jgi:putative DNA primase/helicase
MKPNAIVNALLDEGWKFAVGGGDLYTYQQGVYVPGVRALRHHLFDQLGTQWEPARVTAVIQALKDISPDLWTEPSKDRINLANGLYDRGTGKLSEHTPDHLSQVQLPIEFDESATCPKIERFLTDVFPEDSSILAYEILGYLTTTDTWLKRAVYLLGAGNSGKSTFCKLVRYFLGQQNTGGTALQDLSTNRFATAELHGKLANVFPDLPSTRVENSSIFKTITGDDQMVHGEHKYERGFQFYMFCRLLFICRLLFSGNEIPQSADQTDAYLDRWLVLLFKNTFPHNPSFLDTLVTPEELSGLFNLAISAYQGVIQRGDFTSNEATQEGTNQFKEAIVPVIAFLRECCDVSDPKFRTDRTDLYHAFCGWCSQSGRGRPSNRKFYDQMRQHFPSGSEIISSGNRQWTHLTFTDEGHQALEHFRRRERQ